QEQLTAATAKVTAQDGGRVLTKDEATAYQKFLDRKLTDKDLDKLINEHGKFTAEAAQREEAKGYADAAKALGFENIPAFTRWMGREGLVLTMEKATVRDEEGKKSVVDVPHVRSKADDKAKPEPLQDYMDREVPEFLDGFRTAPASASAAGEGE